MVCVPTPAGSGRSGPSRRSTGFSSRLYWVWFSWYSECISNSYYLYGKIWEFKTLQTMYRLRLTILALRGNKSKFRFGVVN